MCIASMSLTCDLTVEQLRYIAKLVGADVAQNTAIVRSGAFDAYGPNESDAIHCDIRIGASILGSLPRLPRMQE